MSKRLQLEGQTFGFLKVLKESERRHSNKAIMWVCRCELCGKITEVRGSALKNGHIKSCGCTTRKKLYVGMDDCEFYPDDITRQGCRILTERLCETRGKCGFYIGGCNGKE